MSRKMYEGILDDLQLYDGDFQLRLHFYNEPLLDKRLPELIRVAKAQLPGTFLRVVSNGSLLTVAVAEELFRAGLDQLVVSGHKKEDVDRLLEAFRGHDLEEQIAIRRDYLRNCWSDRLASVPLQQNYYTGVRPIGVNPWGCSFLTVQIDYLGQVHQCCEDYQGDLILGNVEDRTVTDLLHQHLDRLKQVYCGRFEGVCAHCAASDSLHSYSPATPAHDHGDRPDLADRA